MPNLSDNFESIATTNVYGVFLTPIGVYRNPDHKEHKQLILDYIRSMNPEDVNVSPRSDINTGIKQLGGMNILMTPELAPIRETISKAILEVNDGGLAYDMKQPVLTDSVLELADKGSFYAPHEYSNTVYSGVYYVNFDHDQHSQLKWKRCIGSPFYPIVQMPQTKITPFNQLDTRIPTEEGDIVIFPSNLSHGYESNTHGNRITLSFNVAPYSE